MNKHGKIGIFIFLLLLIGGIFFLVSLKGGLTGSGTLLTNIRPVSASGGNVGIQCTPGLPSYICEGGSYDARNCLCASNTVVSRSYQGSYLVEKRSSTPIEMFAYKRYQTETGQPWVRRTTTGSCVIGGIELTAFHVNDLDFGNTGITLAEDTRNPTNNFIGPIHLIDNLNNPNFEQDQIITIDVSYSYVQKTIIWERSTLERDYPECIPELEQSGKIRG